MVVAAHPGRAAGTRRQTIAFANRHNDEWQQRAGNQQQRDHWLRNGGVSRLQRQRYSSREHRQQPRRSNTANYAANRQCHYAYAHQERRTGGVFGFFGTRRAEERDAIDFRHTHHRQRTGNCQTHCEQRPQQTGNKRATIAQFEEGLIDNPFPGKPVQRRQRRHCHQPD